MKVHQYGTNLISARDCHMCCVEQYLSLNTHVQGTYEPRSCDGVNHTSPAFYESSSIWCFKSSDAIEIRSEIQHCNPISTCDCHIYIAQHICHSTQHIPYGGKISRMKTFVNFIVWWLFTKVFSAKLEVWCPLARHERSSFLCENRIFHQFVKFFSLESFPLYSI